MTNSFLLAFPSKMSPGTSLNWTLTSALRSFKATYVQTMKALHYTEWFTVGRSDGHVTFATFDNEWNSCEGRGKMRWVVTVWFNKDTDHIKMACLGWQFKINTEQQIMIATTHALASILYVYTHSFCPMYRHNNIVPTQRYVQYTSNPYIHTIPTFIPDVEHAQCESGRDWTLWYGGVIQVALLSVTLSHWVTNVLTQHHIIQSNRLHRSQYLHLRMQPSTGT